MPNIIELTDFNDERLDIFARLTEGQLKNRKEPEKGMFIAESPKVIERALDAGYIPVSLLMEHKHVTGQAADVIERCTAVTENIPVFTAELDVLTQLTGFQLTRGVLCAMRRRAEPALHDILRDARRIAVLENVVNPTNVGAIFRSAAALGMDAVLLTPACCDPLYRRSVRVSMGTVFQIPWAHIGSELDDWPESGLELLREYGFKTAAMALREDSYSVTAPELQAEARLAIVLGTEGEGLGNETIADCDYTVKIPMYHGVDSLNVAAASAVAFWELRAK